MATAQPTEIDELFECPVCFDSYTDPRILQCAHQFCLKCLQPLVVKKPTEPDMITCPTCRHDTPIKSGEEVRHLPRPVLMNEVQNKLANLLGSTKKSAPKYCNSCEAKDIAATKYCYQCHQNMCDSCLSDHDEMPMCEGHKSVAISDYLFCKTHENVVTAFCHNCKSGICSGCAMKDHRKHKTEDINTMATQSRSKVRECITSRKSTGISPTVSSQVKSKVKELEQSQKNIVSQIDRIINSMGVVKSKLESTRNEVIDRTSADIKTLNLYETDLGDPSTSNTSLIKLGQYLLDEASDPELVLKAMELPTTPVTTEVINPPIVNVPAGKNLSQLETEMSKLTGLCDVKYEKKCIQETEISKLTELFGVKDEKICIHETKSSKLTGLFGVKEERKCIQENELPEQTGQYGVKDEKKYIPKTPVSIPQTPITNLKRHQRYIKMSAEVYAVTFNANSQLAVRTDDMESPLKIYTVNGKLVKCIGRGIQGLDSDRNISFDTRRDLYLAPCGDHLTTIDMKGKVHDVIKVQYSDLCGVTYSDTSDQYIVTDLNYHSVVIIDAKSRKVVSSFGSKGSGKNQFNFPYHVCVGDIDGRATIVVSDSKNHAVKLFDETGLHLKTYGRKGADVGQLCQPRGVAVDPAGRIIICDCDNKRLMAVWEDESGERWQCLLDSDLGLGGFLAVDNVNSLVAVQPENNIIQIYTGMHDSINCVAYPYSYKTVMDKFIMG